MVLGVYGGIWLYKKCVGEIWVCMGGFSGRATSALNF